MKLSIIIPNHNEPKIGYFVRSVIRCFPEAEVIVVEDIDGLGKGWAIRKGVERAHGNVICFIDGDGDIHPSMINRLLPFIDYYDIVVGRKDTRGFFMRSLITFFSRIYIKIVFNLDVDTQTGVKIFRDYTLFPWNCNNFAFDIEILAKAKKAGYSMVEVPVSAYIRRHVSVRSIWNTLVSTLRIKKG